jgi:hypothetical protein
MLSPTKRRELNRTVIRAMRMHAVWSGNELRDRPDALRERNEALLTAKRALVELMADHNDEVRVVLNLKPPPLKAVDSA